MRHVNLFIKLTPDFSLSFFSGWAGETAGSVVTAATPPPIATLGGGLIRVVARGDNAGAGAGVVANRATTAAGTDAELDVLPAIATIGL